MKLNAKVYRNLTGEPFDTQVINGKQVEFHYMDDTPYLVTYASRGRFAIWASDGINYKVLIESKYHQAMNEFYQENVNEIWLDFLERIGQISRKVNLLFIVPTLLLYIVVAIVASILFEGQMLQVLLGVLVLIIVSNMIQNRVVGKKVRLENQAAQDRIRALLGPAEFDRLIMAQQEHYDNYFKFEEPTPVEDDDTLQEIEVVSEDDQDKEEKHE